MRGRLTAAFALVIAVLTSLVCGSLIWYARFVEERNADALLHMAANNVRSELDEDIARLGAARFVRQESEELRKDGLVLVLASPQPATANGTARYGDNAATVQGMRTVRIPGGRQDLVLGLPWRKIEDRLRAQAAAMLTLSLFGVVIGTVGAWLLVGKTLSPIAYLSAEADAARVDRLQVCLTPPSSDAEIVHLVTTLNRLLDRLSQAASVQARFYAAASHELRTPLHTLSGHLEVGLSRDRTNAEYREAMEEAYRQTSRLASLVQDLLLLTRLNTIAPSPARESVDLAELCERMRQQFESGIETRGLSVVTDYDTEDMACAAPNHAEMVVRNLMENAVNYTTPGGTVAIFLQSVEGSVHLDIYNDCAPLGLADVRQLLEPFFRPDVSRQAETGGNGLGLAICDAIARTNAWGLDVREKPGGFRVTVRFPPADEAC